MSAFTRLALSPFAIAPLVAALSAPAAAQFNPGPNPIATTVGAQTLTSGTGTVNAGGAISIASGGAVALNMSGTSTLVNNGTIQTLGTGRAIDSNSGTATLVITNNGLISSVSTDAFRVNTDSSVQLVNTGTIRVTAGGQAIDWAAITTKSNTLDNRATGVITAVGEDAVRPGTNGIVLNAGTIQATPTGTTAPSGSDGIDLRTFTGIQVTNTGSITGRHGIATDGSNTGPSTLTVNNSAGTIAGLNGSGLNIDGVSVSVTANVTNLQGATIRGGVLAAATDGDGDGIDIDGILTLNNRGMVLGLGAKGTGSDGGPNHAQAVSIGGGTIVNYATGQIIGSTLAADAPNGDPTRAGEGILADNSSGGNAIALTTITNDGLIQGKTGAAIRLVSAFADTVTNNAGGIIRGAGTGAALQTGDGANTVTNRGSIVGDNGTAIDLQGGNDLLRIEGGAAAIAGNVSGGAGSNKLEMDLGAGNTFSYSGALSSFDSVEIESGKATLSGVSTYTGVTRVSGGTLILLGSDRLSFDSALELNGGTLELEGAGGPNGQTFASFALTDSSVIDLDFITSLTFRGLGTIAAGKTLTILGWDDATRPDYAFRLLGDYSSNALFLSLLRSTSIDGLEARLRFDGTYTDVFGVPEPSTLAIAGLGIVLLVARRRTNARALAG